jgi:hypothetical protein
MVVSGKLDLETAQHEIAIDWIAAYKKYIGPSPSPAIVLVMPERARTDRHHPIRVAKPQFQLNRPKPKFPSKKSSSLS